MPGNEFLEKGAEDNTPPLMKGGFALCPLDTNSRIPYTEEGNTAGVKLRGLDFDRSSGISRNDAVDGELYNLLLAGRHGHDGTLQITALWYGIAGF